MISSELSSEIYMLILCLVIVAIGGAYRVLCWLIDRHFRARRQERAELARWQARAKQAAADVEAARARRDLATCLAIWTATKHDIPHQTRRTEEDQ